MTYAAHPMRQHPRIKETVLIHLTGVGKTTMYSVSSYWPSMFQPNQASVFLCLAIVLFLCVLCHLLRVIISVACPAEAQNKHAAAGIRTSGIVAEAEECLI